ncbi:MAG: hypothetical protein H6733_04645 [Alphaproteobacteria bacterium]|nr:hypothetical protein [Alphaproteobacteria bacterium]
MRAGVLTLALAGCAGATFADTCDPAQLTVTGTATGADHVTVTGERVDADALADLTVTAPDDDDVYVLCLAPDVSWSVQAVGRNDGDTDAAGCRSDAVVVTGGAGEVVARELVVAGCGGG